MFEAKVKFLKPNQFIELLPATPEVTAAALLRFETVMPTEFRDPGFLKTAIAQGRTIPQVVHVDGRPAYFLTYHNSPDGGLWADVAQRIPGASHSVASLELLAHAFELLAHNSAARYIRFTTARAGLVQVAQSLGYVPEAVLMSKGVQP